MHVTSPSNASEQVNSVPDSEDALALAFTQDYAHDWCYVAGWGKWQMWDGRRWKADETLLVRHLVRLTCRAASAQTTSVRTAAKLSANSTISAVESLARSDRRHACTVEEWDADNWLLNTPGGVVDLRTGQAREHDRDDRMTKITTATPKGQSTLWKAFLSDVSGGNEELQNYLQRMVGYCLTGSTEAHALFFSMAPVPMASQCS